MAKAAHGNALSAAEAEKARLAEQLAALQVGPTSTNGLAELN